MPRRFPRTRQIKRRKQFKRYKELGPLKTQQLVKFTYADSFTLNPAAALADQYIYSCNGIYDPDITGIGHQPRGFDQVMSLYDHYVVIGAKLTLYAWNPDTTYGNMTTVHIQDDATTTTDPEDIMERRNAKMKILSSRNGGIDNAIITYQVNPNTFLGRSKPLADPDLKGSTAANPTEQAYFVISTFGVSNTADTGGISGRVKIEYTAVLIEPQQPTKS